MTLVDLMIGLAIGLLIVGATVSFAAGHARERRSALAQARLAHDLQSALDAIVRSVRRSGYRGDSARGLAINGGTINPYAEWSADASNLEFRFSLDAAENNRLDSNEHFGFRLRDGIVDTQLGADRWQPLTDERSVRIDRLLFTPRVQRLALDAACATPCPAHDPACPRVDVRTLAIEIGGRSLLDPQLARGLRTQVRLRNDLVSGQCPV